MLNEINEQILNDQITLTPAQRWPCAIFWRNVAQRLRPAFFIWRRLLRLPVWDGARQCARTIFYEFDGVKVVVDESTLSAWGYSRLRKISRAADLRSRTRTPFLPGCGSSFRTKDSGDPSGSGGGCGTNRSQSRFLIKT
jgi:hypothetical protein